MGPSPPLWLARVMRLSIVVPVLNEGAALAATLDQLQPLRNAGHEVIVVDGGSQDASVDVARPRADHTLVSARGRAVQMNAGAAAATGDVIVFLHADSVLPADAATAIAAARAEGAQWGRFDITITGRPAILPLVAWMMNARSRLTGIATGDQAIFVDRATFAAAGGFPPIALMEDIALSTTLRKRTGPPACLRQRVITSGRRWEQHGPWRTIITMWRLRLAYAMGADPERLARIYS